MKLLICGNCQAEQLAVALRAIIPDGHQIEGFYYTAEDWKDDHGKGIKAALDADFVMTNLTPEQFSALKGRRKVATYPLLYFSGFHPDLTSPIALKGKKRDGRTDIWIPVSAISSWAYRRGIDPERTAKLFRAEVFKRLGYFDAFNSSTDLLAKSFRAHKLDFEPLLRVTRSRTVFMRSPTHPKMSVALALAETIATKLKLKPVVPPQTLADILIDPLADEWSYGCFPPIAEYLGVEGSWVIRVGDILYKDIGAYIAVLFEFLSVADKTAQDRFYENDEPRFHKGIGAILETQI